MVLNSAKDQSSHKVSAAGGRRISFSCSRVSRRWCKTNTRCTIYIEKKNGPLYLCERIVYAMTEVGFFGVFLFVCSFKTLKKRKLTTFCNSSAHKDWHFFREIHNSDELWQFLFMTKNRRAIAVVWLGTFSTISLISYKLKEKNNCSPFQSFKGFLQSCS